MFEIFKIALRIALTLHMFSEMINRIEYDKEIKKCVEVVIIDRYHVTSVMYLAISSIFFYKKTNKQTLQTSADECYLLMYFQVNFVVFVIEPLPLFQTRSASISEPAALPSA